MSTASATSDPYYGASTAATSSYRIYFTSSSPSVEGIPLEVFRNLVVEKPIMTKQTRRGMSKWLEKQIKMRGRR